MTTRRADETWAELIAPLARKLAAHSDDLAAEILGQARLQMPDLISEPDGWDELYTALDEGARTLADRLERGEDPAVVDLPPAALMLVRNAARSGTQLAPLTRVYRFVQAVLLADAIGWLTELAQEPRALGAAAEHYAAWVGAYLDHAQMIAEEAYIRERERWLRSSEASSADTIEALLEGRQHDVALASQRLRHDLRLEHVALVAWSDKGRDHLADAVTAFAKSARCDAVLLHPLAVGSQTAWMSRRRAFEDGELAELSFDSSALVALGTSRPGIEGFRRSHAEAREARRIAMLAGRRGGSVTRYAAVALTALATVDLDQARAFVDAQLGTLGGEEDVALRLAATLRVYLEENASPTRTAKRLGIHENTVANRVRQAEQLLGRDVAEQRLELHVALSLAPLLR